MEEQKEGTSLKKQIEAILFAAGRKVELEEILRLTKNEEASVKPTLEELKRDYESSDSPMFLIQEGTGWKMTVREKYLGLVKDVAPHTELNKALLETLAIIAWKQPVMQADVIKIRGSSAYEHIRDLGEMGFLTKIKQGRSFVLKPSTRFFDYFDLPSREAVKEVFKDVELDDTEKRKDMGETTEEQQKIEGDIDTYEPGEKQDISEAEEGMEEEKLGQLPVYEKGNEKDYEKAVEDAEQNIDTEKLGKLDVFEEPSEEEIPETQAVPEEQEPEEEEPELESDEEKTKQIVDDLMKDEQKEEEQEHRRIR
ncbi:SMC-Scp complex subunit ScpB [Thermoproteota archaeon]